ncbi:MAG: hypothetical protein U0V75_06335 [Ferruginibacter sp.]
MKYHLSIPLLLLLVSCRYGNDPQIKPAVQKTVPPAASRLNYDSCKKQVLLTKEKMRSRWHQMSKTEKKQVVIPLIAETIIPNWIGTKWDFNGVSEEPQKGTIACGYFVTTVLRDAGFQIARSKLAQCASEQMIRSLVQPENIHRFSNVSIENFISTIPPNIIDIYLVGLDNHTGFIYNDGKDIYFIHSTYVGTRNVQKELAVKSSALKQSRYRVLARLGDDGNILNNWIH